MNRENKALRLDRETVRALSGIEMGEAAGGRESSNYISCFGSCNLACRLTGTTGPAPTNVAGVC
ncbi:MAG TPA: hypothetical protein VG245_07285 [Candidatus Dormibacteraeota bacterium]|jgi:hypothetical protein|nr:hypothetical protein [Candidatus Dormibacteraeota bacterium]